MGCCNLPPCLINRVFPKSVDPALGVLGVPDAVAVDLEEFDAKNGWILDGIIDQQGGTEVVPLLVQPLLYCILSISSSRGFLCSV